MSESPSRFVLLDNSVISTLCDGQLDALRILFQRGCAPAYCRTTLDDMAHAGNRADQLHLLDSLGAWCAEPSGDGLEVRCRDERASIFAAALLADPDPQAADELMGSMARTLRNLISPRDKTDLSQILDRAHGEWNRILSDHLQALGCPAGLLDALRAQASQAKHQLANTPQGQAPADIHAELLASRLGPDLNGLRPPWLLRQVARRLPAEAEPHGLVSLDQAYPGRAEMAALLIQLALLGFGQDKGTRKADPHQSEATTLRMHRDNEHIVLALGLHGFVTQDKMAARKHFALCEHFELPARTLFIDVEQRTNLLSARNWPL